MFKEEKGSLRSPTMSTAEVRGIKSPLAPPPLSPRSLCREENVTRGSTWLLIMSKSTTEWHSAHQMNSLLQIYLRVKYSNILSWKFFQEVK